MIAGTEAIVPAIETLVQVKGPLTVLVSHIRFEKITFSLYDFGCVRLRKGHVSSGRNVSDCDGYRIDPKMERDYLNSCFGIIKDGWGVLPRL